MIARSRPMHCSSARWALAAKSVQSPASSAASPKRRARASAACSCPPGPVEPRATSRSSGWRESVSSPVVSQPDVGVVVVAAGAGVRAGPGEPKQFRPILGVPMLLRALRPFTSHPDVGQVIVVVPAGFEARPPEWLGKLVGDRLALVAGGATRAQSVRAGLGALPPHAAVVLVHDAARPFVTRETIDGVLAKARAGLGAVAAIPVSDTVKDVEQERITRTVARERLWRWATAPRVPRAMSERGS